MKTFVDLFCGAGGLSCGLELAGFSPVFACELDPVSASTYSLNNPGAIVRTGDVRNLDDGFIDEMLQTSEHIDLLVGGPPCQGYSINAPSRSLEDPRNRLFEEYLRIAAKIRPKAIIIENVPGIVSFANGLIVKTIMEDLQKLGYAAGCKILSASQYGIPQMRHRTFFLAMRDWKKTIEFPSPTHQSCTNRNFTGAKSLCFQNSPLLNLDLLPEVTVWDAISDLPPIDDREKSGEFAYPKESRNEFQKFVRTGSSGITSHICAKLSDINRERLKYIPQGGSWRDIPYELLPAGLKKARRSDHTKRYGRLSPHGLCSTIMTKCDPHWGCFFHPFQDRVLSVREAARIQGFPDRYQFTGNTTQKYRQIGNAVPPILGMILGRHVTAMLEEA